MEILNRVASQCHLVKRSAHMSSRTLIAMIRTAYDIVPATDKGQGYTRSARWKQ